MAVDVDGDADADIEVFHGGGEHELIESDDLSYSAVFCINVHALIHLDSPSLVAIINFKASCERASKYVQPR